MTFLLTDVEGSTTLWQEAPEAMRHALARHDALFEQAIREHGGVHIWPRGEGDSRFAVFAAALVVIRQFILRTHSPGEKSPKSGHRKFREGRKRLTSVHQHGTLRSPQSTELTLA